MTRQLAHQPLIISLYALKHCITFVRYHYRCFLVYIFLFNLLASSDVYENLKRLFSLLCRLFSPPRSEELDLDLEVTGVLRVLAGVNDACVGDVVSGPDVDVDKRLLLLGLLELEN